MNGTRFGSKEKLLVFPPPPSTFSRPQVPRFRQSLETTLQQPRCLCQRSSQFSGEMVEYKHAPEGIWLWAQQGRPEWRGPSHRTLVFYVTNARFYILRLRMCGRSTGVLSDFFSYWCSWHGKSILLILNKPSVC